MALSDISQIRNTDPDFEYTAGEEPWNKDADAFIIPQESTESVTYQCDWVKWHGIYRNIPEIRSTIDVQCKWIIGKKLTFGDTKTKDLAKRVKGNGKDTLRKILKNIKRTSKIAGDCYAWAPRDKAGRLLNLKILDPGTIEIVADKNGVIKQYNQVATKNDSSKLQLQKKEDRKIIDTFKPEEIFHLRNENIGDEIHGIPDPEKLQKIIKKFQQGIEDYTLILHRYGKPTYFYEANTDDDSELNDIQTKIDQAQKEFKNVILPKDTLNNINKTASPQFSILDPTPWINVLRNYFAESSNVPDIVRGRSGEVSLAAGKLNFLGFKESIIFEQLEFSEELESQLGLKIKFEEPVEIDIEISKMPQDMKDRESAKKNKEIMTGSKDGTTRGSDIQMKENVRGKDDGNK